VSIALREFTAIAIRYLIDGMKTIEDIRVDNLRTLVERAGGVGKFAEKAKKQQAQISQLLNRSPDSKTGKQRGMSSAQARQLEAAGGMEHGWLDHDHSAPVANIEAEEVTMSPEELAAAIKIVERTSSGQAIIAILRSLTTTTRRQQESEACLLRQERSPQGLKV
jgi:hypothetical protein